ncbi:hypothetical protein HDA39_000866 [Kribbella italica]|uniref:Uncharacterized protein n=1 Tax=Kribbella italica TaxID=1540520 RepID=A0A7W9J306_9ACTN|nr:hypothetical protein [Kribbella italica]
MSALANQPIVLASTEVRMSTFVNQSPVLASMEVSA